MITKPCKRCGAPVLFETLSSGATGGQPFRTLGRCSAGHAHSLWIESGFYDLTPEEQWKDDPDNDEVRQA